jgi:glutathione S-transferase
VLSWEPPARLLLGWQINTRWSYDPELMTEVELTFAPAEGAAAMPKAHVVFNELSRLLAGKAYLADEQVRLADMLVAPQLDFLAGTPEWQTLTAATPNLVSWLARMNDRASFKSTTWERVAELAKAA